MLAKEQVVTIIEFVCKKKELFKDFMMISQEMVHGDLDLLVELDERRTEIRNKLEAIDEELKQIYESESDADYIVRVLKNVENRGDVCDEYLPIFDASQELLSIAYRVKENEELVMANLIKCRQQLMEQIKDNQQSSKVIGYLKSLDQNIVPEGSLLSPNSRNA